MRKLGSVAAALVIATAASGLGMPGAFGSNHREATNILKDPTADNTDLYAFVAPDAVPATANPNRLGALAGDNQGFPNSRRLADDVTDIELRVIAEALLPADQGGEQIPLGDGVDQNDKPFRATFPYVALPDNG